MPRKKRILLREQDPFLNREKEKYNNPLPSREFIIDILTKDGVPISIPDLIKKLKIKKDEENHFNIRLKAMVRDGQIYINRRNNVCVADKINLVNCKIQGHKDGYGFGIPINDSDEADFIISEKDMRSLMHEDLVTIRPSGKIDSRGRRLGRVVEILERAPADIVVRIYEEKGILIGIPEDKRIAHTIIINKENSKELNPNQICLLKLDTYPVQLKPATGHIIEVLGDYNDPKIEIDIAIRKYHLPYIFSEDTKKEIENIPEKISQKEINSRIDLRNLPFVTIDGETARDFDDAVFAQKTAGGYNLKVAIADVSYYVKPDSAIDKDAYDRGTSVYFPRKVIPMLPEYLSNNICSLKSDVDRLVMVCDIEVNNKGDIENYKFYPSIINNRSRLTYNQVWDFIENGFNDFPYQKNIEMLYQLFKLLVTKRKLRGALDFETEETQITFDENNKILKINLIKRNDIHKLIEECMLLANVCAANFIKKNKYQSLFRSHPPPSEEKISILKNQLSLLGLTLSGGERPSSMDFSKIFSKIKDREDKSIIQTMLLRSMQQAVYHHNDSSHFGLAYDSYTHFTSPIRRYPDLVVHRTVKKILKSQVKDNKIKNISQIGIHSSLTERRADEASRDVEKWLKTYYMQDKIGEIFNGIITGVTNFGVFVTLNEIYIEGMIHISDLGQDYFYYRPGILAVEGEKTRVKFKIGDSIVVKVVSANLDSKRIDLSLISGGIVDKKTNRKKSSNKKTNSNKVKTIAKVKAISKPKSKPQNKTKNRAATRNTNNQT